ncbi:MAG: helix-turn-helix transcriptional regulator [Rhizobacter sp.]|nr:helix-turn-helix transcriptional regulator [Ferruginibacter sp.]
MSLDLQYATMLNTLDPATSNSFVVESGHGLQHTEVTKREQWKQLLIQTHIEPPHISLVEMKPVPETQIILIMSGAMRMKITSNGKEKNYDNRPGHLFFTAANADPYQMQWNSVTNIPIHATHLYLSNDLLAQTALSIAGTDPVTVNLMEKYCVIDPVLEQLGYSLVKEMEQPEASSEIYAETAAQLIAVHLLRNHCTTLHRLPESYSKLPSFRLKQINEFIHSNMEDCITLSHLASIAFMSCYHFCRVFKRTTGVSPNQYVIIHRMKKAVRLLTSGLGVEEAANAVGYKNVGHFTQLFKRHTGYLPAAHRRAFM